MNLVRHPQVKRLATILVVMAVIELMTGESGNATTPPTTGPHGAFFEKVSYFGLFKCRRWAVFLTLAVIVYGIAYLVTRYGSAARRRTRAIGESIVTMAQNRKLRFAAYGVVVVIAVLIPLLGERKYWMYLIFQLLGVWLVLGEGLNYVLARWGNSLKKKVPSLTTSPLQMAKKRSNRFAVYGVLIVIALSVPHIVTQSYWMYLIVEQVGVWILLAEGLNVVVGFAGLLDLGFVAFYAIGAYTTAWLTGVLPAPPFLHHVIPTLWVIPIGVVAAMIVGILLGIPTLRLRGDYLAIVTLGFALIIDDYVGNQNGITGGGVGSRQVPYFSIHLGALRIHWGVNPVPYYYLCLIFVVLFLVVFSLLEHSRVGRAWVALREDEVAAESIGINPLKYKVMAFAVGAASGGFAGVLSAGLVGNIGPTMFQYQASINILVLVIFGGMGSIWGVALGAVFLQMITSYLDNYQPWGFQLNDLFMYIGALLIVMMIFRPAGLMPSRRRKREIQQYEETGEGHLDDVLTADVQ
ncbi:MAG: branched-chain amino acid ABC transporter permease [Acidimicrobiales bacterium]